jgi:hypothetical protein
MAKSTSDSTEKGQGGNPNRRVFSHNLNMTVYAATFKYLPQSI